MTYTKPNLEQLHQRKRDEIMRGQSLNIAVEILKHNKEGDQIAVDEVIDKALKIYQRLIEKGYFENGKYNFP